MLANFGDGQVGNAIFTLVVLVIGISVVVLLAIMGSVKRPRRKDR